MAIIQKDSKGFFSHVNGWTVRPQEACPTEFRPGELVNGRLAKDNTRVVMSSPTVKEQWQTTKETK